MNDVFRKLLSAFLVLCVLAIGGLAHAQSAEHGGHHAHHQAATHSTEICAWFCAAGQAIESASVQLNPQLQSIEQATVAPVDTLLSLASFYSRFRGPPVSSS
jgi:hypothetical protein